MRQALRWFSALLTLGAAACACAAVDDFDARLAQGAQWRRAGQTHQALALLTATSAAAATQDQRMRAAAELGLTLAQERRFDEARAALTQAYQLAQGEPRAAYALELGTLAARAYDDTAAARYLAEAARAGDARVSLAAALNLARTKPDAERLPTLQTLAPAVTTQGDAALLNSLGHQARALGATELAWRSWEQARRTAAAGSRAQAFGAEARARGRFSQASERSYEAARLSTQWRAFLSGIGIFFVFSSVVGVLWVGAQGVIAKEISAGLLSQFVIYAVFAASSLGQLSEVYGEISQAAGAASRLSELLAEQSAVDDPAQPVALPVPIRGEIAFANVGFAYPTRGDDRVIKGLSFTVRQGERVAIVGPSGAGKSTIFQLLLRFYDPISGSITLDGIDIRRLALADLRGSLALVAQEPAIFATSIADNIRYAKPDASDADVETAARQAAADPYIERLSDGYETIIGERGITLSGGERQRLAIARAILKDAPVLLLDEATSALDAENEHLVQDALEALMRGRTSIVIAHRLATVLNADRILVMDRGEIIEQGTHQELIVKRGLYARLAALQFADAEIRRAAE